MPSLSSADHHSTPPTVIVPRDYNAAHDLIERNLIAGRAAKIAYIDDNPKLFKKLSLQTSFCIFSNVNTAARQKNFIITAMTDGTEQMILIKN